MPFNYSIKTLRCRLLFEKRFSPYLDGELELTKRQPLEAHLAECERCRTTLAEMRFASRLAGKLPPPTAAETIVPFRGSQTIHATNKGGRRQMRLVPLTALVVLMLAALTGFWM